MNKNDEHHGHAPRVKINPPVGGESISGSQSASAAVTSQGDIYASSGADTYSEKLIDIWEEKIRRRLAELHYKNHRGEQDRGDDLELAPLYLEVLNRQLLQFQDTSIEHNPIIRLDSVNDLIIHATEIHKGRDQSTLPWRQRAAMTISGGDHDVAVDIYGDERGVSILVLDSAEDPSEYFEEVKEYIEASVGESENPIRSVLLFSNRVQKTSFGCSMDTCHAIKQLVKKHEPITRAHQENLHKASVQNEQLHFVEEIDARRLLPPEFLKLTQDAELLEEFIRDFPELSDQAVTHKPGRLESLRNFMKRAFQEMLTGDTKKPSKLLMLNTAAQRFRTRLYMDGLTFLSELRKVHGDGASTVLQAIVEKNTPLRPSGWEKSLSSWIKPGSDDLIKGPIALLQQANERFLVAIPTHQGRMMEELLNALPHWQSPQLRMTALLCLEIQIESSIQSVDIQELFTALVKLKKIWGDDTDRPDRGEITPQIHKMLEQLENARASGMVEMSATQHSQPHEMQQHTPMVVNSSPPVNLPDVSSISTSIHDPAHLVVRGRHSLEYHTEKSTKTQVDIVNSSISDQRASFADLSEPANELKNELRSQKMKDTDEFIQNIEPTAKGNQDRRWLNENIETARQISSTNPESHLTSALSNMENEQVRLWQASGAAAYAHKRMRSEQLDVTAAKRLEVGESAEVGSSIPRPPENENAHGLSNRDIQVIAKWLRGRRQTRYNLNTLGAEEEYVIKAGTRAFALTEDQSRILVKCPQHPDDPSENILIVPKERLLPLFPRLLRQLEGNNKEILLTPGLTLPRDGSTLMPIRKHSPGRKR